MKKSLLFYILLCIGYANCMEKKIKNKNEITKRTANFEEHDELISYLEALMSGGNFCIDIPTKTVSFKHYSEEKKYTRPFNDLPNIETTSPELIPDEERLDYFHKQYDIIVSHAEEYIQKIAFQQQLQRFSNYVADPLYSFHQSFLHIKYLRTRMNGIPQEERRTLDGYPRNPSENNEEYLASIAQRNQNRVAMNEALQMKNFKIFRKACMKETWLDYKPLRDSIPWKDKVLPAHFKGISLFISFIEAMCRGGNFKIIENELQFQHFKKNHKKFRVNLRTPPPFNSEYSGDALKHLLESIHDKKKHDDYLLLLSLLSPNQKKAIICLKEVLRHIRPRSLLQSNNKEALLEELQKMNSYEKINLDGFDITQQDNHQYCSTYIDRIIEIRSNFSEMDATIRDGGDLQRFLTACKKPLSIAYIPFNERLKQQEEEISQLRK